MNKIFWMISAIMLSLILVNCSRKRDGVSRLNSDVCESMDYDSVVAIYEHIDSVTGETSLLPFDSLYPEEQDRIFKLDSADLAVEQLRIELQKNDPLWYVPLDSLAINGKPLSEIIAIYGKPRTSDVDTLRYGVCNDGLKYEDGYYDEIFKDVPFAIAIKNVWSIDSEHTLELYFKKEKEEQDVAPFSGWIERNWYE